MVERCPDKTEVESSILSGRTRNNKQPLRAVFVYWCEAERCEASRPSREPGPATESSGGETRVVGHLCWTEARGAPSRGREKCCATALHLFVTTKCEAGPAPKFCDGKI